MNTSIKRKRSQLDDSDEDEPTLGRQVLPVANLPDDFNGEPMDGFQYLFTVRRNARQLPHITRVHNPYEIVEGSRESIPPPSPSNFPIAMPSEAWRELFCGRFRNFCKNSTQPTTRVDIPSGSLFRKTIPEKKERDAWWAFISGRPEVDWNPPKKPRTLSARQLRQLKYGRAVRGFSEEWTPVEPMSNLPYQDNESPNVIDIAGSLPTPSRTPVSPDREVQEQSASIELSTTLPQREPTPLLLREIDHRYSLHLLMYFTYWINSYLEQPEPRNTHMSETHARWIFTLLSRVEDFVSADDMSLLRSLARACIGLLKNIVQNLSVTHPSEVSAEEVQHISPRSCWLILTTIAERWAQRDLWTETESMLAALVLDGVGQ